VTYMNRFFETSAAYKTDTNIKSAFCMMIHDLRKELDEDFAQNFRTVEVHEKNGSKWRRRLLKCIKCLFAPCGRCSKTMNLPGDDGRSFLIDSEQLNVR
jgi:hypothetical protein